MKIEEMEEADADCNHVQSEPRVTKEIVALGESGKGGIAAKRALVLAGARILFYPTLFYNLFRNKIQPQFRWWDLVDEHLLLGAVPFPKDVPRLKQLGVGGVITLNEPYETLVPSSLYKAYGIEHLVIPTRDYMFAPSVFDINRAVKFIHKIASCGTITYVHCKAGRGRSTTIVLCYLVEHRKMTPEGALEYVRSIRPRVLLAPSQWKAVKEYGNSGGDSIAKECSSYSPSRDAVFITKADLEGYRSSCEEEEEEEGRSRSLTSLHKPSARPMIAKLSCLFASLTTSGVCGSVTRQLAEAPAC